MQPGAEATREAFTDHGPDPSRRQGAQVRRRGMWHDWAVRRTVVSVTVRTAPSASPRQTDLGHPRRPASSDALFFVAADRSGLLEADRRALAGAPALPWWGHGVSRRRARWGAEGLSAASRRHEIRSERQCVESTPLTPKHLPTSLHVPPRRAQQPLGFPCVLLKKRLVSSASVRIVDRWQGERWGK